MAISGFVSKALRTASLPLLASATTSYLGWASRILRSPERTTSWSSAIRILIMRFDPRFGLHCLRVEQAPASGETLVSPEVSADGANAPGFLRLASKGRRDADDRSCS